MVEDDGRCGGGNMVYVRSGGAGVERRYDGENCDG